MGYRLVYDSEVSRAFVEIMIPPLRRRSHERLFKYNVCISSNTLISRKSSQHINERMLEVVDRIIDATNPHKRIIARHLSSFVQFLEPGTKEEVVVDVGSGKSPYRHLFATPTSNYISLDIRMYPNLSVIGNATMLPFKSRTADTVLLIETLEHLPCTREALLEVSRVLRPNGHVVLTVPFIIGRHDAHDFYRFTQDALEMLLRESGLKIVEAKRRGGVFASIAGIMLQIPESVTGRHKYLTVLLLLLIIPFSLTVSLFDSLDRKGNVTLGYDILAAKAE